MKDELGGAIMSEFAVLTSKFYSFERLMDQKTRNVKESWSVQLRKLYRLTITRIVS